jgi:sigma-B regulation protein RsbU (phosphoserine phosphatase)
MPQFELSEQVEALLRRVPLFAELPAEELYRLAATLRLQRASAGTMLFGEGDPGDRLYIVLEGEIAIIKSHATSDERFVNLRGPGEFIGEMSLLTGDGERTASARAHSDVQLLELTSADFETLMAGRPTLALQMLKVQSRRLRDAHDHTIRDLHEKNERLARAYGELQEAQAQLIAQEAMRRELRLARDIQQRMLPRALPQLPGFEIGARILPAQEVGGDFYDLFPLDDGRVGLVVGDVCGKGVPAALYMALVSSLLRAEAVRSATPDEALHQLNRHLNSRGAESLFVTLLYGVLDPRARTLDYVRAGHEYPLVWAADGALLPVPRGRSIPVGLLPDAVIERATIPLPPGVGVLFSSDGVSEAQSAGQELFGRERLLELIGAYAATPAQALCDQLLAALATFQGAAPQADDITLLAVRAL